MNTDLIRIAELFEQWLEETSEELNMDQIDLQEIIKLFLN